MIDDKSEEPTPFGMLRYAEDYRIAAEKVIGDCNPLESGLLMPAYNLIGQSIELSLKAYLLSAGLESKQLRVFPFGHRINALLAKAEELGLVAFVPLDGADRHIVASLSARFETHEFRYIKVGTKTLPYWSLIAALAGRFTQELHDHCLILRIGEEAARQRIAACGCF